MTSSTCFVHLKFSLSQVPNNLNFFTLSTVLSFKRWSVSVRITHFRYLPGGNNHVLGLGLIQ